MLPKRTRTTFRVCATVAVLVPALWGCTGKNGGSFSGAFYGTRRQGAAGTFRRDGLRGVFGAVRQPDAQP